MALLEGISQHYIFILKDKQTFRVDNGISMFETGLPSGSSLHLDISEKYREALGF